MLDHVPQQPCADPCRPTTQYETDVVQTYTTRDKEHSATFYAILAAMQVNFTGCKGEQKLQAPRSGHVNIINADCVLHRINFFPSQLADRITRFALRFLLYSLHKLGQRFAK